MDEKEKYALTHVLVFMEQLDKIVFFDETMYDDLLRLHRWLEKNYPLN